MIAERRNLAYEQQKGVAGECCSKLKQIPPCIYSINAFGDKQLTAFADPPDFFKGGAERQTWPLKPATVCVWPYEEMYSDAVKGSGARRYNYDARLEKAKDYFAQIDEDQSLVFYYANYSNPLNQEDDRRYAIVGLSEQFLEIADTLREMGDNTEDWSARIKWLQSLVAELWQNRGLYPGVGRILDVLGFEDAIPFWKSQVEAGNEKDTKKALFAFLDGKTKSIPGLELNPATAKKVVRQWKLRTDDERTLLRDKLPRFDLYVDQIERLLSDDRVNNSIYSSLADIRDNPYILCEEFVGNGVDDTISFSKIDHGVFPSPDLGGEPLAEIDDGRRLRGACVDQLRRESKHTFVAARKLIHDINRRLSYLPEWKSHQFNERYFEVDEEDLEPALVFREHDDQRYVYPWFVTSYAAVPPQLCRLP